MILVLSEFIKNRLLKYHQSVVTMYKKYIKSCTRDFKWKIKYGKYQLNNIYIRGYNFGSYKISLIYTVKCSILNIQ